MKKADIALMIAFTATAALGLWYLAELRVGGGYADIIRRGSVVQTLELSMDTVLTVTDDGLLNVIQISGGAAEMIGANCPDSHCIHQRPIMYTGQTIVCLPNRLVIQIRAAAEAEHDVILR